MLKSQIEVTVTKNNEKIELVIKPANYKVEQELKAAYAIAYRKSIAMGVATRSSMVEILKREQVWGDKEDEALTKMVAEVGMLEVELSRLIRTDEPKDKQKDTAIKLAKARNELYSLVQIKSAPLMHTAEAIAEDFKIDKYIAICTYTKDGKPFFKDHEELISRRNDDDVNTLFDAVIDELSKDNIELLRNFPENKWLVTNGMMDENGEIRQEHIKNILSDLDNKQEIKLAEPIVEKPKTKRKSKKPQGESV